jgi:hypothetical protein
MGLVSLGISAAAGTTACEWDTREFSALSSYERLDHLMTCGVYGVEPDRTGYWSYQLGALLVLFLLKFLGAGVLLAAPGFWYMGWLSRKGHRSGAPYSIRTVIDGRKFPILYLRPFASDAKYANDWPFLAGKRPESRMAKTLTKHLNCPMVAIADPKDDLGDIGALRVWVSADWRTKVTEFMRCAPLVVLRLGVGEGLLWELQQAFAVIEPTRLVLEVPGRSLDLLDQVRASFPGFERYTITELQCRGTQYVVFDADWKPSFLADDEALRLFVPSQYAPVRLVPPPKNPAPPSGYGVVDAPLSPSKVGHGKLLVGGACALLIVICALAIHEYMQGLRSCAGRPLASDTGYSEAQVSAMREEQLRFLPFAVQNQRAHDLQMPEVQMALRFYLQRYLSKDDPKRLDTQAQYLVDHTPATSSDCASFLLLRRLWADL